MDSAVGSLVWVKGDTPAQPWQLGVVQAPASQSSNTALVKLQSDGRVIEVSSSQALLANSASVEDMINLQHLHEPGVLHNLDVRYASQDIYTSVGSILVAVNPFRQLPHLFAPSILEAHMANTTTAVKAGSAPAAMPPHVYGIACNAYTQMMRDHMGQSILITGESGAGKTETSKLIMQCLASLGAHQLLAESNESDSEEVANVGTATGGTSVEQKVLESNPLLEAFGNAKTVRNDNSSRFGKYVELIFDDQGSLKGAAVRTYLLERSRVVHVAPGERSFHAFYQLCAGASPAERAAWHLRDAHTFRYLSQSGCYTLNSVNDATEYKHTRHAMAAVGMSKEQQEGVFRLLAAILHLGDLSFSEPGSVEGSNRDEAAPVPKDSGSQQALANAAQLLGVDPQQLLTCLTTRTRQTPEGPITSPLSVGAAEEARNALSKVLFARAFSWLVDQINTALGAGATDSSSGATDAGVLGGGTPAAAQDGRAKVLSRAASALAGGPVTPMAAAPVPGSLTPPAAAATLTPFTPAGHGQAGTTGPWQQHTIGLLDIYGFESFESNDLEQLCINLANEKLQQHFNQHVFKWEQAEYINEGIDWRYIEFVDNQDVLDLIEGRLGLMDLLDEQCRFPTATGEDLATKYATTATVASNKRYTRLKRPSTAFSLDHYAGPVRYLTDNFLDKNKDFVVAEQAALMSASQAPVVASLFAAPAGPGASAQGSHTTPHHSRHNTPLGSSGSAGGGALSLKSFKFDSVCAQFKRQLSDLMAALAVMQPHYVRCIKPNPASQPGVLDHAYVLQQLRCGGVMEAVRISCAGFAFRRPFAAFLEYFWPVAPSALHQLLKSGAPGTEGPKATAASQLGAGSSGSSTGSVLCDSEDSSLSRVLASRDAESLKLAVQQVLEAAGIEEFQMGHTKVFLRPAQSAKLDNHRSGIMRAAACRIQAAWRGFLQRRHYLALRQAAVKIQAAVRAHQARVLAALLRKERAAIVVQSAWRARAARQQLAAAQQAAVALQCAWRSKTARAQLQQLKQHRAATVLQSAWRARGPRRAYLHGLQERRAAVKVQAAFRGYLARRSYAHILPQHRAALHIQRAWRASRQGERLREAFRAVVIRMLELSRAAVSLQAAWRCKAARMQLARLRQAAQRQRFREQLRLFESGKAGGGSSSSLMSQQSQGQGGQPQSSSQQSGSGAGAKSKVASGAAAAARAAGMDVMRRRGAPRTPARAGSPAGTQSRGLQGELEDDTAVTPDVSAPTPEQSQADRLRELRAFKLSPLLDMWRQVERQQASVSTPPLKPNAATAHTSKGRSGAATPGGGHQHRHPRGGAEGVSTPSSCVSSPGDGDKGRGGGEVSLSPQAPSASSSNSSEISVRSYGELLNLRSLDSSMQA